MSNVGERRRQVRRVRMQWISGEPAQISIIIESDFHLAGRATDIYWHVIGHLPDATFPLSQHNVFIRA